MRGVSRYRVARLSEIPSLPTDLVDSEWKPLRHHLGIRAFGTNAFVARAAGGAVAEEPGTAVLAVGAVPGTPFAVSEWERRRTPG